MSTAASESFKKELSDEEPTNMTKAQQKILEIECLDIRSWRGENARLACPFEWDTECAVEGIFDSILDLAVKPRNFYEIEKIRILQHEIKTRREYVKQYKKTGKIPFCLPVLMESRTGIATMKATKCLDCKPDTYHTHSIDHTTYSPLLPLKEFPHVTPSALQNYKRSLILSQEPPSFIGYSPPFPSMSLPPPNFELTPPTP